MKKVLIITLVAGVLIPVTVFAASIHGGTSYTLPKGQTNDGSLYAGAGTISIAGDVTGDLVVAGGQITVSGSVKKDILVGGGTIDISGTIGEDVRVTGGQITIDTTVPGDVVLAGGSITLAANSIVEGDLLVAGGSVAVKGEVKGQIKGAAGEIFLSGPVGGNVGLMAETITLEATAKLGGDFSYQSPEEATIADGATIAGKTTFTQREFDQWGKFTFGIFGATIISWLIGLVTLLAAAVVMAVAVKRFNTKVVEHSVQSFWRQLLLGLALLIITPFVIGILFASVVGALIGLVLMFVYIVHLILAGIYAGIIAGAWIFRRVQKGSTRTDWVAAILGVVVLQLLMLIPVIGWLAGFVFFLVALGSLVRFQMDFLQGK